MLADERLDALPRFAYRERPEHKGHSEYKAGFYRHDADIVKQAHGDMEGEGHVEGHPCDEPAKICGPRQMTLASDGCEQPHHQQRQCQRNHTQGNCAGLESNPLAEQYHALRQ